MLKPGWMNRYMPPEAIAIVPDVATRFGFVWAGLMFFSAGLNLFMALRFGQHGLTTYAGFMSIYAMASKIGLFVIQYATMRFIGIRRRTAALAVPAGEPATA
jgi:hypothetical protein